MSFVFAAAALVAFVFAAWVGVTGKTWATVENVLRARRGDSRRVSLMPLVATIFGAFGVLLAPVGEIRAR